MRGVLVRCMCSVLADMLSVVAGEGVSSCLMLRGAVGLVGGPMVSCSSPCFCLAAHY